MAIQAGGEAGVTLKPLRLIETYHVPFYTPHFVMLHLGVLEREGYAPTTAISNAGRKSVEALLSGTADIALCGALRTVEYQGDESGRQLVNIAEVNQLDGFFVLSRLGEFTWPDLEGRRLIIFGEAPTPWLCLRYGLRRAGIDPSRITVVEGRRTPEAVAAFTAGEADFIQTVQPAAERLLASGAAKAIKPEGPLVGVLPFSSYITTWRLVRERPELVAAFLRAYYRALRYLHSHSAAETAHLVWPSFPDLALEMLERIVGRYVEMGTWPRSPVIRPEAFDHLQEVFVAGGWIPRKLTYEESVDVALASRAVQAVDAAAAP